jgi:hypothetical protein
MFRRSLVNLAGLVMLCIYSTSSGQSSAYGVRLGLNATDNTDSKRSIDLAQPKIDHSSVLGLAAGVDGYLHVGSNFALGAQVLYLTRGYSYQSELIESPWGPYRHTGSSKFRYLELPLSLRYTFADIQLRPHIYSGFSLGMYLNGTTVQNGEIKQGNFEREDNLAVFLGAGVQYDILTGTSLVLDLTYSGDISIRDEEQLRLLRLMLGIAFW